MKRALLITLALCGCRDKRKPIGRADGGPSVVVSDGRAPDLGVQAGAPEREPNDTVAQAQVLAGRVSGAVSAKDVDVYRVDAVAVDVDGGVSVADVVVSSGDAPIELQLLDDKGKTILSRATEGHGEARITSLQLPAWLRVRGKAAATYSIDATARTSTAGEEVEPNDDVKRANALPESGAATGTLDPGDRDSIGLPASPDLGTWRVELAAIPDVAPKLELRRGDQVVATSRGGKGGELRLRNLPGGPQLTLTLRSADGSSTQPYALRVATEPPIDAAVEREPNDDVAHATKVQAGDVAGYLWPGDVDVFCAEGAGVGAHVDGIPDVDFKLELLDGAGKPIAKADEGKRGSAEQLAVDPRARCVRLSAHGRDTAFDAPYRLTVTMP